MKALRLFILLLLILENGYSRDISETKSAFWSAGSTQVKEDANFGMVFTGAGFNYGMNRSFVNEKRIITLETEVGFQVLFSRKIPALDFYIKPVDMSYMFKCSSSGRALHIGPFVKLEYDYYMYPQLQSGFDYWFIRLSLGINALYRFMLLNSSFNVKFGSSVFGIVSRQPEYRDPYFFDIGIKYAIRHMHQSLAFASFNSFNTADLEIMWKKSRNSRISIGYSLKYSGYYNEPDINMISQSIKIVINKKQN
jgi:hypothetical protein